MEKNGGNCWFILWFHILLPKPDPYVIWLSLLVKDQAVLSAQVGYAEAQHLILMSTR